MDRVHHQIYMVITFSTLSPVSEVIMYRCRIYITRQMRENCININLK
uniref:Uncharacterized protein n=1 Tax=Lepeophtheirus salmonis TaxID=72036 RepID=A0A0K2V392_LEPSM